MKKCNSGRVIVKERRGKKWFFLRLNLIDSDADGKEKYTTKDIATNLPVNKRNKAKANAMLEDAITEYSSDAERMFFHKYLLIWLEAKRPTVEITTYEGYRYRLNVPVNYFDKNRVLLTELKPEHIRDFYNYMLEAEHGSGKRFAVGYSNRSIKDTAILLLIS